jgi:Flp pilus assembly protein TadB
MLLRLLGWRGVALIIGVAIIGAVILWISLFVAAALVVVAAVSLVPFYVRMLWARRRRRGNAVTIRGDYTRLRD